MLSIIAGPIEFGFWDGTLVIMLIFGPPIFIIMLIIWALAGRKNKNAVIGNKYIRKKDPNFWIMVVLTGLILTVSLFLIGYNLII